MTWDDDYMQTCEEYRERQRELRECPCHQCRDYRDDLRASQLPPQRTVPLWYARYAKSMMIAEMLLRITAVLAAFVAMVAAYFDYGVALYGLMVSIVLVLADLFLLGILYGVQAVCEICNYLYYWYVEAWPRARIDPFTDGLFHVTVVILVAFAGGTVVSSAVACLASDKNFLKFMGECKILLQAGAVAVLALVSAWVFVGLCNLLAHCYHRRCCREASIDQEEYKYEDNADIVSQIRV